MAPRAHTIEAAGKRSAAKRRLDPTAQQRLRFRSWGGARPGAGRPKKPDARAPHARRPRVGRHDAVHVTLRASGGLPSLRGRDAFAAMDGALRGVLGRPGFRVVHFSVQTNHLHLLVEAHDATALSFGMQALAIRAAKALNRALRRRGPVFRDRFHARVLRTPREARDAVCYVLQNFRRHATTEDEIVDPYWVDPCSSGPAFDGWRGERERPATRGAPVPVSPARTWLLALGWRRYGLIRVDEVPRAGKR